MRKLMILLLVLMTTASIALAADPVNPADPEMVAALLTGYTFVDGIDDGDELRLLMRNAKGELVFIGGVARDDSWHFTESTPLPEGTILGVENFTHSLGIPSGNYYHIISVVPYADGTWGVSLIYPDDSSLFILRKNVIYEDGQPVYGHFGDHPWSDIAAIDWTNLPQSFEEALSRVDDTRWAVVSNPDSADRLHLRTTPSRSSLSLGKYYNRTPVQIREYGDTWCAVTVCGLEGYMMTQYLAFGENMDAVEYAGPWLDTTSSNFPTHPVPDASVEGKYRANTDSFIIMGVAGDFYHVWFPYSDDYAYIFSGFLHPGNG